MDRMRLIPSTASYHQQRIIQTDRNVFLLRIGLIARDGLSALTGLRDPVRCSDTGCALSMGMETQLSLSLSVAGPSATGVGTNFACGVSGPRMTGDNGGESNMAMLELHSAPTETAMLSFLFLRPREGVEGYVEGVSSLRAGRRPADLLGLGSGVKAMATVVSVGTCGGSGVFSRGEKSEGRILPAESFLGRGDVVEQLGCVPREDFERK